MIIRKYFRPQLLVLRVQCKYHNLYDVLEVDCGASQLEIKRKFYELAKKYHPDSQDNFQDPNKFIQIKEAYETLRDQKKRMKYDNSFYSSQHSTNSHNYSAYQASQTGFQRPFQQYYQYQRTFHEPKQPMFTILKKNWLSLMFYGIYAYLFLQIFKYFRRKLEEKDREHRQMMLESSHTVSQNRRKYYANEMRQKGIYGQQIELKYRLLTKESTRAIQKRKLSLISIEGIQKEGKKDNEIVLKPEYL